MLKKCSRCKEEKPIVLFQKRKASKDGFTASCKACISEYDKSRANLPHRIKARIDYSKTKEGKIAAAKAKKKYIEKNPIKRAVHILTGNAIRGGIINKQPCEICSSTDVHAHHDDYAHPLKVRWLCAVHHKEWHLINGEGANAL